MEAEQVALAARVIDHDTFDMSLVKLVGGLDITWGVLDEPDTGIACLVILSWPGLEVVHEEWLRVETKVAYQPGLLGFRECPAYAELFQRVQGTGFDPEVLFVDGFGVAHPRRCGSASQLGILIGKPTIGVGKSLNSACLETEHVIKERMQAYGAVTSDVHGMDGSVIACAVRKDSTHISPVYVSVGHMVSLETAVSMVQLCCRFKIPEPIRKADIRSREHVRCIAADSNNKLVLESVI